MGRALALVESRNPATLSNPDPIKRPVQGIQGIEESLRLSFSTITPKTFCHLIQGLDGSLDISSTRCLGIRRLFLGHLIALLQGLKTHPKGDWSRLKLRRRIPLGSR